MGILSNLCGIFGQGILAAFNLLKLKCSRYIVPRELSCKDGLSKGQSGTDLAEAEEIKKRWQEYTEELYKKGFNDLDKHDGVITHSEPDILECEVKWASGSITTN